MAVMGQNKLDPMTAEDEQRLAEAIERLQSET